MRDPDSVEMLNIIRSSRVQDTELVYNFLGLRSLYDGLLNSGSAGYPCVLDPEESEGGGKANREIRQTVSGLIRKTGRPSIRK